MKTLKNLFLGVLAICLFTITAKAQTTQTTSENPLHFGVGLESGITTSGIASKTELGATARLQYDVSKNFALTLTSGYYEFLGTSVRRAMGMVPVKLGLKAFVGSGFYFSGEGGIGIETQNFNAIKNMDNGIPMTTKLLWSGGFGYAIKSWDFSLRYESFFGSNHNYYVNDHSNSNFSMIGLRVGYNF
ncbi:MAG TPA: hypothetical protein VL442_03700 [Mucilaginibacter sp.]|nr:hypothetical protein [Mucilaginibacter sp.]